MRQVITALVATLAAQLLVSMAVGTGSVVAPVAAVDIGVSPDLIGGYIGIIYACAAATGLVCGGVVARFGAVRMTQFALVVAALALVVGSFGTLATTIACAMLSGCANGPMTPSSSHVLARVTPPQWRNAVFSAKQMGVPLGNGLAGLMMPVLAVELGWRAAALIGAVLCIGLTVALQPWRAGLDTGRETDQRLLSLGHVSGSLRLIFGTPTLRQLSIMSFVYAGLQNSFVAFTVTYLHQRLDMDLIQSGLVLTVSLVAGAIGRLIWGTLTDRFVDPYLLLGSLGIGMAAAAILTACFTPAWPFGLIVAVSIAFGATTTAWNGVFLAQIAVLAPPGRVSEATGGSQFYTFAGVTIMPALFSVILSLTGSYAIGYGALAVLAMLSGLWVLAPGALRPRKA